MKYPEITIKLFVHILSFNSLYILLNTCTVLFLKYNLQSVFQQIGLIKRSQIKPKFVIRTCYLLYFRFILIKHFFLISSNNNYF